MRKKKLTGEDVMAQYRWKDLNTGKELEIIRSMRDSSDKPDKDECLKAGFTVEEFAEAEWTKVILGGAGHVGFGQKGSWAIFFVCYGLLSNPLI